MDGFEHFANWVNDMDTGWWPFLFMRPKEHEKMTSARVFGLAALYGVFAGMLANAALAVAGQSVHVLLFPASATLGFFLLYRFTFAYCWNRRAERLAFPLSRKNGRS